MFDLFRFKNEADSRGNILVVALIAVVVVILVVVLVLAGRSGDEDQTEPAVSSSPDRELTVLANNAVDDGRNWLLTDFEYGILGTGPTGHDAPVPDENYPRSYYLAVKGSPGDEELDDVFNKDYAESFADFTYDQQYRNISLSSIAIYDYYEGIENDFQSFSFVSWSAAYAGGEKSYTRDGVDLTPEEVKTETERFNQAHRKDYGYQTPPYRTVDSPADSFTPGYWRVGEDINPGTYTTTLKGLAASNQELAEVNRGAWSESPTPGFTYSFTPPTDSDNGDIISCQVMYVYPDEAGERVGVITAFDAVEGGTLSVTLEAPIVAFSTAYGPWDHGGNCGEVWTRQT